jgi:predicted transcriptional regulator
MSSVKEEVLQLIQALPDDCTLDDIKYRLYLREKVQQGLADLEQGRVLSAAEVDSEVEQWLKSFGPAAP